MNVTTLQADMLRRIARSEYSPVNGSEPERVEDATTWTQEVINSAQDQGVWTSLFNAGLIDGMGGREGSTSLTGSGFAAYKSLAQPTCPIEDAARQVIAAISDRMPTVREVVDVLGFRPSNRDLPRIMANIYTLRSN